MREIRVSDLNGAPDSARFVIMKKTAFGYIDINEYFSKMSDAIERMIELPYTEYRVFEIEGR